MSDSCGCCGRVHAVMLGMAPGRDGEPWQICAPCYRPAPKAIGRIAKPARATAKGAPAAPAKGALL